MARKPRALVKGGIYHVTSRGNERSKIFWDNRDRERFLERLEDSATTHQVRVFLYCVMPNHVHLVVETPMGNLDRFMASLLTGYTVYFNRRHQRTGHLMQGRYGAQMVEGNEYLLKLSRYVHLNPVHVAGAKELPLAERIQALKNYSWSSFREYAGQAKPSGWLATGPLLALVGGLRKGGANKAYAHFVEAGLASTDEEFVRLMGQRGIAIGSDGFVERVKGLHGRKAAESLKREDVSFRQIRTWKNPREVENAVRSIVGDRWARREARKEGRTVRCFLAWALHHHAGLTQREIAPRVGVGTGAAVCQMIRSGMPSPETAPWRDALDLIFKG